MPRLIFAVSAVAVAILAVLVCFLLVFYSLRRKVYSENEYSLPKVSRKRIDRMLRVFITFLNSLLQGETRPQIHIPL